MHRPQQRTSPGRAATYILLGLWSLICAFPLYWLALASIRPVEDLAGPPHYLPFFDFAPSLAGWRFILADPAETLLPSFFNSLLIGTGATALSLLAVAFALYGGTRVGHGGQRLPLAKLMLAVRVVPPVVIALPVYVIAASIGMLDTRSLMIGLYAAINLPVAFWLLAPVFGQRPTDQEEAALLDGASHLGILFSVLLPMILRSVAVTGLLLFILCWNEYLFAAYLTFDHAGTLTPWMVGQLSMKEAQAGGEAEELSHMAAAAVFMAVPALVLAAAVQRFIGRSIAALQR
ncbi:carbohydrate ABC transporter permease [Aestuariivirga sp.]|uniref:carbohydrate ABC transporter permease n=1 Tax=Aestuariivirga sp. TaxID=2650926 RepID=UPI0039E40F58